MRFLAAYLILFGVLLSGTQTFAQEQEEALPLWEYGVGLGFVHFYHYPASDQSRDWVLPVPIFQYRGEILRADDREGARAYLLREKNWTLEMGGGGLPSIESKDNHARNGMDDLPWAFQLGPQIVSKYDSDFQVRLGVYQAMISPDWKFIKANGVVSSLRINWHLHRYLGESQLFGNAKIRAQLGLTFEGGSKEFMETYYGVSRKDATLERPEYEARDGFLSTSLSYFQSIAYRKHGIYFGLANTFYGNSANRKSPLHRDDTNLSLIAGITYTLGESERRAILESQAEGALEKIRHRIPFRGQQPEPIE